MPKPSLTKDMEMDFREALLQFFFSIPRFNKRSEVELVPIDTVRVRHNYHRAQNDYVGAHELYFRGNKFAKIFRKPHKRVVLFDQFNELRMPSKILERVVITYIPQAKVEHHYGE